MPPPLPPPPIIILVEPQLGENIGAAARAMANFGAVDLRLVTPRDGWPNPQATASASRANHVLDAVRVFDRLEDAVADLNFVYATTRRDRDLAKPVCGPVAAAEVMVARGVAGERVGVLFGRERWGLNNDEIVLADEILTLPVVPEFASLNIAQAVLVIAYEWRKHAVDADDWIPFAPQEITPATKQEMQAFYDHLETALDAANYFRPPEKRPNMIRNLRTMFQRVGDNANTIRTLHGVIAALERRRPRQLPRGPAKGGQSDDT